MAHLRGYGKVKVFQVVSRDGGVEHWATDELSMGGAGGAVRARLGDGGLPPWVEAVLRDREGAGAGSGSVAESPLQLDQGVHQAGDPPAEDGVEEAQGEDVHNKGCHQGLSNPSSHSHRLRNS